MEGLSFPLLIFLAWVVLNVIRGVAKAGGAQERRPPAPVPPSQTLPGQSSEFLEMLRQLEAGRSGRQSRPRAMQAPPVEDEPEFVENVQTFDAASEAVIRQRRLDVQHRNRPRTSADHAAFDARIRAEPEHTGVPQVFVSPEAQRLRQALIWNELLGPPVSLRGDPDAESRRR